MIEPPSCCRCRCCCCYLRCEEIGQGLLTGPSGGWWIASFATPRMERISYDHLRLLVRPGHVAFAAPRVKHLSRVPFATPRVELLLRHVPWRIPLLWPHRTATPDTVAVRFEIILQHAQQLMIVKMLHQTPVVLFRVSGAHLVAGWSSQRHRFKH